MGLPDNRIPEDQLPQCWSDDERMNALFAPFRLKSSNPESWNMKMKFWSEMLRTWCRCRKDPVVSAAEAKVAFQRKGRTPACLEIVIEEMYRNGNLSPITKYQQVLSNGQEGWVSWGARLALRPAAIALTAVTYMLPKKQLIDNDGLPKASIDATQRFVVESVVQDQATKLLQDYPAGAERVGTVEHLLAGSARSPHEREAFEILLGYLVAQGYAVKKGEVVKLAETSKKITPITETDEALFKLLVAEKDLSRDSTRLARDAVSAAADAKAALQLGNRLAAKNHLRRKHKLLERAEKCAGALENVRQLLHNMREMEVNKAVIDTYKTSAAAMKRGMAEGGLDENSVLDTMDDLKDVLTSYSEVERALSSSHLEDVDAAELEEELKDLLSGGDGGAGSPGKGERSHDSIKLPTPPTDPLRRPRVNSERDFIFDGEEQMLAELEQLDSEDGKVAPRRVKVADTASAQRWSDHKTEQPRAVSKQSWCPEEDDFAKESMNKSLDELCKSFSEMHTDQRLHPGQKLSLDFKTPPQLYGNDFQVRDHIRLGDGVWLYNCREGDELHASTDFVGSESPRQRLSGFDQAPGGERPARTDPWHPATADDLQSRLDNLRGFKL